MSLGMGSSTMISSTSRTSGFFATGSAFGISTGVGIASLSSEHQAKRVVDRAERVLRPPRGGHEPSKGAARVVPDAGALEELAVHLFTAERGRYVEHHHAAADADRA